MKEDPKSMLSSKEIIELVRDQQFFYTQNLKKNLSGEKSYPITKRIWNITQKNIKSELIAKNFIDKYTSFYKDWESFTHQQLVQRESKKVEGLGGSDRLPTSISLQSFADVRLLFTKDQNKYIDLIYERSEQIAKTMNFEETNRILPFFAKFVGKYIVDFEKYLNTYEYEDPEEKKKKEQDQEKAKAKEKDQLISHQKFKDLLCLLPQLKRNMGKGLYLRVLPIKHVDTKFIEKHTDLIETILKVVGIMEETEELEQFLGINPEPKGFVRMLILDPTLVGDPNVTGRYAHSLLTNEQLRNIVPVGKNVIIIENVQSGYMLPPLKDTIAIFGGGKNVDWAQNEWLKHKERVVYWGDLDVSGFICLSILRQKAKLEIPSLMMDQKTIELHLARMCADGSGELISEERKEFLNEGELAALDFLANQPQDSNRLEQEKLDQDYITREITQFFA